MITFCRGHGRAALLTAVGTDRFARLEWVGIILLSDSTGGRDRRVSWLLLAAIPRRGDAPNPHRRIAQTDRVPVAIPVVRVTKQDNDIDDSQRG
jgi:hypothetical protein